MLFIRSKSAKNYLIESIIVHYSNQSTLFVNNTKKRVWWFYFILFLKKMGKMHCIVRYFCLVMHGTLCYVIFCKCDADLRIQWAGFNLKLWRFVTCENVFPEFNDKINCQKQRIFWDRFSEADVLCPYVH